MFSYNRDESSAFFDAAGSSTIDLLRMQGVSMRALVFAVLADFRTGDGSHPGTSELHSLLEAIQKVTILAISMGDEPIDVVQAG